MKWSVPAINTWSTQWGITVSKIDVHLCPPIAQPHFGLGSSQYPQVPARLNSYKDYQFQPLHNNFIDSGRPSERE